MARIVVTATHGADDPNRATLAFLAAKAAREEGMETMLFLMNDAVLLAKRGTAEHIQGVGLAPFSEVLEAVQSLGVEIKVCKPCAEARGISEEELVEGASLAGMYDLVKAAAGSSVLSF
ncbi:MAG: sulfur reduction protein DsrE [Euryarchaeota archaeon]|nr:sulfur reduction protein DsrE [Euryarchaeota archaeon]